MIHGKKHLSCSQLITRNPLDSHAAQHFKAGLSFALKEQLIMNLSGWDIEWSLSPADFVLKDRPL
jgi:hypothetical protein